MHKKGNLENLEPFRTETMNLAKVKSQFEHKSIEKRIDFIDTYDIVGDSDNKSYFIKTIKNHQLTNNTWYNVLMIELADFLLIIDKKLLNKYLGYLHSPNHYLVKLAVLDYLAEVVQYYRTEDLDLSSMELILSSRYDRLIVKNQILLFLFLAKPSGREYILTIFKLSLLRTSNNRSFIRTFNFIKNYLLELMPRPFLWDLIKMAQSKNLGKAVEEATKSFQKHLEAVPPKSE